MPDIALHAVACGSILTHPNLLPRCCHGNNRLACIPALDFMAAPVAGTRRSMRKTLTDRLLRSLKPKPKAYDIWDAVVPSCGVRVLPSGVVTFVLGARFSAGRPFTRRALGGYGELSLLEAREKAREWLKLIGKGIDPQAHEEQQRRAKERERQNTFAAVAEDFIRDKLPGERKGREVERDIRREFIWR
jgi:hypothetical protein